MKGEIACSPAVGKKGLGLILDEIHAFHWKRVRVIAINYAMTLKIKIMDFNISISNSNFLLEWLACGLSKFPCLENGKFHLKDVRSS